jgi:hypothetical protein
MYVGRTKKSQYIYSLDVWNSVMLTLRGDFSSLPENDTLNQAELNEIKIDGNN